MKIDLNTAPLSMDKTGLKKNALSGEVAVVTGGTSNIGLATARSLAWLGAKVVIAARNPERGAAAAEFINKENKPGTALFVSTDISSEASIKAMAQKAFDTFGKVDILVNNAMDMSLGASILKGSVEQLDKQYAIGVRGVFLGIKAFLPGMQQRHHGVITYLTSTFRYPYGPSNYCAVKSAGSSLMASLASELGPYKDTGIAVFHLIPTSVGRPRPVTPGQTRGFVMAPAMPGYPGPIPPEDCGAGLSYAIVHAGEIHGSGIMIQQAFHQMNWPFPKPETAPQKDYDRIRDEVMVRMFGFVGPGFPKNTLPFVSINRSEFPPDPRLDNSAIK